MARITKVGTWTFSGVLQSTQSFTNLKREIAWMIKETLVAAGMTVKASSNRVTTGNADYWATWADVLVRSSGNIGTWIVLRHSTGGELLIAFNETNYNTCRFFFSPSVGFTGGDLTAIPTAADAWLVRTLDLRESSQATMHSMVSAAGTFRCVFLQSNIVRFCIQAERLRNAHTDLSGGYFIRVEQILGGGPMTHANLHRVAHNLSCTWSDNSALAVRTCTPGVHQSGLCEILTETNWDGFLPNTPIDIVSTTPGKQGMLGRMEDAWFGPSSGINTGDTFPDDASNPMSFVQFDDVIWPWDGTVPVIG